MVPKVLAVGAVIVAAAVFGRDPQAQDASRGSALFAESCASCHSIDGRGLNGPNLTMLFSGTSATADDRVFQTIRSGVSGSMPASQASEADIRAIIGHLKTLVPSASVARAV